MATANINRVVLTGNLQKMMQDFLGRFTGSTKPPKSEAAESAMIVGLWAAYLGGVVAGALIRATTRLPTSTSCSRIPLRSAVPSPKKYDIEPAGAVVLMRAPS